MSYNPLPTRTSLNANAAADVNLLQDNITAISGNGSSAPSATIQELYTTAQALLDEIAIYRLPSYDTLTANLNATTPATKVDVAWAGLRIGNRYTTSKSYTLDITASGVLGLDTGSTANSTWYYIYAICNDAGSVVSAVMSASAAAPTLPGGYTKYRWISAVYRESTGAFRAYQQADKLVAYTSFITLLSSGTARSFTELNISTLLPVRSRKITLQLYCNSGAEPFNLPIQGYMVDYQTQVRGNVHINTTSSIICSVYTNNSKIRYLINSPSIGTASIFVLGYEVPL